MASLLDLHTLFILIPLAFALLLYLRLTRCNARPPSPPLPPSAAYTTELLTLDGIDTELLHFPGAADAPRILILPGNPGSPYFYTDFATHLHAASAQRLPITITCHACHSAASTGAASAPPQYHDLAAQVRHKVAVARALLQRHPGVPLVLLGHSVGAYMCLEVMRALPEAAVARALLLFPTLLHIGASPNGQALMPLFRYGRWALAAAALALGALPAPLQRAVARTRLPPAATPATLAAALTLVHPVVGVNALYLALTEMRDIGALDGALARAAGPKCIAYFGAQDGWNSQGDAHAVARALGPAARVIVCSEGHPHGWPVHLKSSLAMADKVWEWCKALLAE
jgi:hypothetical protein